VIILCRGRLARVPERVPSIFAGAELHGIDARFILPYYALRLASEASVLLKVSKDGEDVMFAAQPVEARATRSAAPVSESSM
jgi:histidine phosphotransferase ChpT